MTPSKIKVLIEGDDTEKDAKFVSFSEEYNAGLYESDGRQFYVDPKYIAECQNEHKAVGIPLAVITQREKMLEKLRWAQEVLERQHRQESTGIVIPDGISV